MALGLFEDPADIPRAEAKPLTDGLHGDAFGTEFHDLSVPSF
jgi:hypothetical protein